MVYYVNMREFEVNQSKLRTQEYGTKILPTCQLFDRKQLPLHFMLQ